MTNTQLKNLPPDADLETRQILRSVSIANRYLAELKGISETLPNRSILIITLVLQEEKSSSEIENIITTHDEMYEAELDSKLVSSNTAKEVLRYAEALRVGFAKVKKGQ